MSRMPVKEIACKISAKGFHTIQLALQKAIDFDLKVVIYPHIWLADSVGNTTPMGRNYQLTGSDAWFRAYKEFILNQADVAEDAKVDLFVIGVELDGTMHRSDQWLDIIAKVREHHSGPITYSPITCCDGTIIPLKSIDWLSELDYIGLSAGLENSIDEYDPGLSELVIHFEYLSNKFKEVADHFGKQAIFL